MSTARQLFDAAFATPRNKRSTAYKDGVLAILEHRLREPGSNVHCNFEEGTAEADAYFAGCDEGHRIASKYLEALAKEESDQMAEAERAAMYGTYGGR